jgi:hypothetical protein
MGRWGQVTREYIERGPRFFGVVLFFFIPPREMNNFFHVLTKIVPTLFSDTRLEQNFVGN